MKQYFILSAVTVLAILVSAPSQAQYTGLARNNWTYVQLPIDSLRSPMYLHFTDSLNGFFCGYAVYQDPVMLESFTTVAYSFKTTNGGRSWQRLNFGGLFPDTILADAGQYAAIDCIYGTHGGSSGYGYFYKNPFINENTKKIYIPAIPPHGKGQINGLDTMLVSDNNGISWTAFPPNPQVQIIAQVGGGCLVGYREVDNVPQIKISYNGGKNFTGTRTNDAITNCLYLTSN